MLQRAATSLCVLSVVFSATAVASASIYTIIDLGPVGADTVSLPWGVNVVGSTVMVAGQTGSGAASTPVSWTINGGVVTATTLGGGTLTGLTATAVDHNGNIVGGKTAVTANTQAYYISHGGSPVTLPVLSATGANGSVALGISDTGVVIGQSSSADSGNNTHAVAWTQTGGVWGVADLGGFDPNAQTGATAINSSGMAAGWSYSGAGTSGTQDAVTWTQSGSTWTIHQLNPTHTRVTSSVAYGINSVGDVVGWGSWTDSVYQEAVLFKHDGTIVKLGDGRNFTFARAINGSGTVVGYEFVSSGTHAFVSNGTAGSVMDLNSTALVPGLGTWVLNYAYGIDDRGDIIGRGYPTGVAPTHAFLLKPTIAGDANGDGTVNIGDLSILLANFDKTGMTWNQGDFDANGTVNIADLSQMLANFDKTANSSGPGIKAVPEPSSLVLLAISATTLFACAWRRRA
jgi:hypothetical protein